MYQHCEQVSEEPFVVPPTWNNTQYHKYLQPVWEAAITELREAENIIVCGYSLPPMDQFFRFLFALGTVGEARLKGFYVFDPNTEVRGNFHKLLGPVVRDRFIFTETTFRDAISQIRSILKVKSK